MNEDVELSRHTWTAAIRLAVVISIVAGLGAVLASTAGDIPQVAIVLPVIIVAFCASWVQTDRVQRDHTPVHLHVREAGRPVAS